ncbi:MAG: carboxypeptidase regulatory-like domain-containing protein [Candidatus Kuenenia sp.]|nr:carboxypeptidase regulatory-like domain-containing protein [Candidatus Kuenenia hertensis]
MLRRLPIFLLCVFIVLKAVTIYAFETGTLRGRIIDGFGKPVSFVDIEVISNGSKYIATTDTSGNYFVTYSPGNIHFMAKKPGFVPLNYPFMIEEIDEIALDDITIWNVPSSGGLFFVGQNDYIKINEAKYDSESTSKEKRFYVKGTPTRINGYTLRIIDFQTDNPLVVGKTLYRVDKNGSVGSIVFYPSMKYVLHKLDDTYSKVADNVGLRVTELPPGKYFYCLGEMTIRSRNGYGFFFEVSS